MAREQVGTAPSRGDDAVTVDWVRDQIAALSTTVEATNPRIIGEVPSGNRDGQNLTLTTARDYVPGSTDLYVNGLREQANLTYTEAPPNSLVLASPPLSGDDIVVSYYPQQ